MFISFNTYAQSSFNLLGIADNNNNTDFRLNSIENNPSNYSFTRDWEVGIIFGGTIAKKPESNIYSISLGKTIGSHYLYSRYTPGYQKEFNFNTGTNILISETDSISSTLKTSLLYKEKFGFGYSYKFTENFSAGLSVRYFDQKFTEETAVPVFTDTLNSIVTQSDVASKNYWRGDIGLNYQPFDNLSLNISSINLFTIKENSGIDNIYEMPLDKGALFGVSYSPANYLNISAYYESTGGSIGGLNYSSNILSGTLTAGISLFNGKEINNAIDGIMPVINYSSGLLSITLSVVKYFSSNTDKLLSTFVEKSFNNIINNQYSEDRISLGVNFALSFKKEKMIQLLDVEVNNEIFPTMGENYLNQPFAVGKVVNISDKTVNIKPSSFIPIINNEVISSPIVIVFPGDTVLVPFFTIINNENKFSKREILQASFFVSALNGEPDDEIQKPILINNSNNWDGKVFNLRFFVDNDLNFSADYAKKILNQNKEKISSLNNKLSSFGKIEILFNHFVKEMIYVSDPRSSVEYVQFPSETINIKGGDCDDLSVGFASLLEGIGIETAFVDYKSQSEISHVNLIINTGLNPNEGRLITVNDKRYYLREDINGNDKIWIPLEMTSLTDFENAWSIGSEKFYKEAVEDLGLAKGNVEIIDIN